MGSRTMTLFRLLGTRLARMSGRIVLGVLDGRVTIARDGWGIPHISVGNDADGWLGLGFCQGQDRAFQLEMLRRVVTGTVAELVGPDGLPIDRLSRRIGSESRLKTSWLRSSPTCEPRATRSRR